MPDTELLLAALKEENWGEALAAAHRVRSTKDALTQHALGLLVEAVAMGAQKDDPSWSDDMLEKALLLERVGSIRLDAMQQDLLAETLVTRNRHDPERALRYARYRPMADACRALLAQFETPARSNESTLDGRVTQVQSTPQQQGRRSVFRSAQELLLFRAARRRFANKVLLPNAALHSVIDFDAVRGRLTDRERAAFFRSLIDLVVVDPDDDYRPIWFFELDSAWHDDPAAARKDSAKERMLGLAGVQLTRIRTAGQTSLSSMFDLLTLATTDAVKISEKEPKA